MPHGNCYLRHEILGSEYGASVSPVIRVNEDALTGRLSFGDKFVDIFKIFCRIFGRLFV